MMSSGIDYAATARRRPWHRLPDEVQQYLAGVLGAPVAEVALAGAGFTHGFAGTVTGGGRQLFAKAAPAGDAFIFPRPDGIDADAWLARSPLSASAAADDIDSWLAILGAYMIFSGSKPGMPSSPMLRPHGRYTARLIIEWLADRRGWNR